MFAVQSPGQEAPAPAKAGDAKQIANFVDVADKAGLTAIMVFGGLDKNKYILETTGTGVAIFDYDNDGWPDIFVVNGTMLEGLPTGAHADQSSLSQQPRRNIHRRNS